MGLAKQSMAAASCDNSNQMRIFFYSQRHVDNYFKTYAKYDTNRYGPTRHLIVTDETRKQEEFKYTHTTLISSDGDIKAIKDEYGLKDAYIVWQGPASHIQYFGPRIKLPQTNALKSQL